MIGYVQSAISVINQVVIIQFYAPKFSSLERPHKMAANVYALAIGWAFNEFSAGTKVQ